MSVIRDISDLTTAIREFFENPSPDGKQVSKNVLNVLSKRGREASITQQAKDSIAQFPVLVSSALSQESVTLITQALENYYASLLRFIMGLEGIDLSKEENKRTFLRRYHQNITPDQASSFDADDFVNTVFSESTLQRFEILNKEQLTPFIEDLRAGTLNELTVRRIRPVYLSEEENPEKQGKQYDGRPIPTTGITSQITNKDIKKINDLVPTIIEVEVIYRAGEGGPLHQTKILIGVKCVSHLIPTEEMTYFIGRSLKEESLIFRFIQWTTGEIRFFRDFVLNLDRIQREAAVSRMKSSRWWHYLRQRANVSGKMKVFRGQGFIPNATVVMTMDEVEYLKNTQAIDLTNLRNAQSLCEIFFLLSFVIMDENAKIAYIYNPDEQTFIHYSYSSLKKSSSGSGESDMTKALLAFIAKSR